MRILIAFLLITLAPIFMYVSCCNCPDIKEKYYKISDLTVIPSGSGNIKVDEGIAVSVDTIFLSYKMKQECLAVTKPLLTGFMNAAYACSCSSCGDDGLKSKIKKIVVSSDAKYNDTLPAGSSLNQIFKVQDWYYYNAYSRITVDTVKQKMNEGYQSFDLKLSAVAKPTSTATHRFSLSIEMENGSTITAVTKAITWQ